MAKTTPKSAALKIHLLGVGTEKYGDCLLIQLGERSILIDGAHASDWKSHDGMASIPDQLSGLLGHQAPFTVDLLVVTHCHSDHIGCLPTLIQNETLKATWALVADEKLGFGRASDYVTPDAPGKSEIFAAAMREEDHSDLPDADLQEFLQDAATLEQRYNSMLKKLAADGTKLFRYGRNDHTPVETEFEDFGLKILGPTKEHLAICANAISGLNSEADQAASDALRSQQSRSAWYRAMISRSDSDDGAEDRPGKGAALNDQSIVLKLDVGTVAVLLAGDMQFAKPEISGSAVLMKTLRAAVKAAGPYTFIKLTHHSSYNGMDDSVLNEWSATKSFAHTGGSNDASHPDSGVLQLLEEHTKEIQWARTDHNGLIGVSFGASGAELEIEKGKLNDPEPNGDAESPEASVAIVKPSSPAISSKVQQSGVQTSAGLSEVSLTAKLDPTVTRLTVTFDIQRTTQPVSSTDPTPVPPKPPRAPVLPIQTRVPVAILKYELAPDRELPNLLFVSHADKLGYNLGPGDAQAVFAAIRDKKHTLYEVADASNPFPETRAQLAKEQYDGVVVVGGYDVLPSMRVDVLPPSLRQQIGAQSNDADNFIVWSDAAYDDIDGDMQSDMPVSRIPDARSPNLVAAALGSKRPQGQVVRFGIRNGARPFAEPIYNPIPGAENLFVCATDGPGKIGKAGVPINYVMLHGSDLDGTRYWGEDDSGTVEGGNLTNIPDEFAGIVFTGCCWGALTVAAIASQISQGQTPAVRTPNASLALSWLHAGAMAYIGCTGSHYSPTIAPYQYFGGPLHGSFWQRYNNGEAPAKALYGAKLDYLLGFPHGQSTPSGQAIEMKIFKQFTCLGLGW